MSSTNFPENCEPAICGDLSLNTLGSKGLPGAIPQTFPASAVAYGATSDCLPDTIETADDFFQWLEENIVCLFAGDDGQANLCNLLESCLAVSDTFAEFQQAILDSLGYPGTPGMFPIYGPDGLQAFSGAVPGDIFYTGPTGTVASSRLTDYLNDFYPTPSPAPCLPIVLRNDGSGWGLGTGMPEPPASVAYPVAPAGHPLQLEYTQGDCPKWSCRDRVVGTFAVPADFPTVNDFLSWARGKTLDVTLQVTTPQTSIDTSNGSDGILRIQASGNALGEVNHSNSGLRLVFTDTVNLNSFSVTQSHWRAEGDVQIVSTSGAAGLTMIDGSSGAVIGLLTINGTATTYGVLGIGNGSLRVGELAIGNAQADNIHIQTGFTVDSAGGINLNAAGRHGAYIDAAIVQTVGDILLTNSGSSGSVIEDNGSLILRAASTPNTLRLLASNNGGAGVIARNGGALRTQSSRVIAENNGAYGFLAMTGGTIFGESIETELRVTGNPIGMQSDAGNIFFAGTAGLGNISGSTARGIWATSDGRVVIGGAGLAANTTITGNNVGVTAATGSYVSVVGANITANTANTNIPVNTVGAQRNYINN